MCVCAQRQGGKHLPEIREEKSRANRARDITHYWVSSHLKFRNAMNEFMLGVWWAWLHESIPIFDGLHAHSSRENSFRIQWFWNWCASMTEILHQFSCRYNENNKSTTTLQIFRTLKNLLCFYQWFVLRHSLQMNSHVPICDMLFGCVCVLPACLPLVIISWCKSQNYDVVLNALAVYLVVSSIRTALNEPI